MKTIICIAGPTASGKSAYALELAKKYGGEIINADALQVYKDLQVLSARPTKVEMAGIPHHLYGCVDVRTRYSAGQWGRDVMPVIRAVQARGKMPILVGGTGLYFKALTEGLAHIPEPGRVARNKAQLILERKGIESLRSRARSLDPVATKRVLGHDPQRLLRIVSVALGTGKPLSAWQEDTYPLIQPGYWKGHVLLPDREALYARINSRFSKMVSNGGLEEAKRIHALDLPDDLPLMKAIGLKELCAHLDGELSLEEAVEMAKRQTRRFAKRQLTWLRGNMKDWEIASSAH